MSEIKTFSFDKEGLSQIEKDSILKDWPVVYIIENGREVYIGETTSAAARSRQHYAVENRAKLDRMHVIIDEEYNKSATLDTEAQLIQYFAAEGTLKLQNGNRGLVNHNYFDKDRYRAKLESSTWKRLQELQLVRKEISDIQNSEIFKYSPYKALTEDQFSVAEEIRAALENTRSGVHLVHGGPGTGKSVLATYLVKALKENDRTKHLSVALVVPMTSLRNSIKKAFSYVAGLSEDMVIGPSEVANNQYDVLIVDEAHRLRQRRNIVNYRSHDAMNSKLGLGKEGTELDWILLSSKHQILFYDEKQSIRPADVHAKRFAELNATNHKLVSQLRVSGGEAYINFIEKIFSGETNLDTDFGEYEFKIYDDAEKMVADIREKNSKHGLCRSVAGYAWSWVTRDSTESHDIQIGNLKLRWNSKLTDWVNSPNAINEVGCIHTVQGYDLNYVGVIVGPDLSVDASTGTLVASRDHYKDQNGQRGIDDPEVLSQYILNIYKTLMTRGMKGCYVYFVDKETEAFFKTRMRSESRDAKPRLIKSPITIETIQIPLVGSAPCGSPLLGEENIEEYIPVDKSKIRSGYEYFILLAQGDSMNQAGINDGDLVLCRQQLKAETGDRVVALLGGENVTIKEYGPREDGVRLLLPRSTNQDHKPITPGEGDSVQGIVQEVLD